MIREGQLLIMASLLWAGLGFSRALGVSPEPVGPAEVAAALAEIGVKVDRAGRQGTSLVRLDVLDGRGCGFRLAVGASFGGDAPPEWLPPAGFSPRRSSSPDRTLVAARGRLLKLAGYEGTRCGRPARWIYGYSAGGRSAFTYPGATLGLVAARLVGRRVPLLYFAAEAGEGDPRGSLETRLVEVARRCFPPLLELLEKRLERPALERGLQPFDDPRAFD